MKWLAGHTKLAASQHVEGKAGRQGSLVLRIAMNTLPDSVLSMKLL